MPEASLETEQYWAGLQTNLDDGVVMVTDSGSVPWGQVLLTRDQTLFADEPAVQQGQNTGPAPTELLLMALGACTAITVRMYAARKGWIIDRIAVRLNYGDEGPAHKKIERRIELAGPLDDEQRARLFAVAEKCPLHRMLTESVVVQSELIAAEPVPA